MSTLNETIRIYVRSQIGRRVFAQVSNARGECWDLAFEALRLSGAKTTHDTGNLYRWSNTSVPLDRAMPGDILQYSNLSVEVVSITTTTEEDGSTSTETYTETFRIGLPNHTAIVDAVGTNGRFTVIEQNMNGRRDTQRNTYRLKAGTYQEGRTAVTVTIRGGSITTWRPESR